MLKKLFFINNRTLMALVAALPGILLAASDASAPLDPAKLMQGSPPPEPYRIHIGNWQNYPQKIWSFQHTSALFPTQGLTPVGPVRALPRALRPLDQLQVGTPQAPLTWPEMLAATHVDAALVLYRGQIIDERYMNGMTEATPHLMMSATKSMVGLMAATLVGEGKLDPNAKVRTVLPELADSAWADATVQQVMDMTDGVRFTEVYTDPSSDIFPYIGAMGWSPAIAKAANPSGIQAMLGTLKTVHEETRGSAFRYRSPATDVTGWLAARAAGQSITSWLQQRLWSRLGMAHAGSMMLDPVGTEVAFAGMSATAPDLARIGQMLLKRGRVGNDQVIPAAVIDDLMRGGSTQAFEAANMPHRAGWSYHNQWWINPQQPRSLGAMGAFGQRLMVFPDHDLVVVLLSSHPQPVAALIDAPHQRAFKSLISHLQTN